MKATINGNAEGRWRLALGVEVDVLGFAAGNRRARDVRLLDDAAGHKAGRVVTLPASWLDEERAA